MASKLESIGLTSLDDLFKTGEERQAEQGERVQIVPADKVFPYARQPYSVDRPTPASHTALIALRPTLCGSWTASSATASRSR